VCKVAVGKKKQGAYAKGENAGLFAWAEQAEEAAGRAFFDMGRGDLGSRFDWVARAAFGAYYNLEIFFLPYLDLHRASEKASILRDAVFSHAGSVYMKAKLFVSAVVFDKMLAPFNTLVNSKRISMTITDLAAQYDVWYAAAARLADGDWAFLVDADMRVFDVDGLGDWDDAEMEKEQRTVDGAGKVKSKVSAREVLYGTLQSADWEHMHVHAAAHFAEYGKAICTSLRRNCADMLSPDGEYSTERQTGLMREVAGKCKSENDSCERGFAGARSSRLARPNQSDPGSVQLSLVKSNGLMRLPPQPEAASGRKRKSGGEGEGGGQVTFLSLSETARGAAIDAARGKAGKVLQEATSTAVRQEAEARVEALLAFEEEKTKKATAIYQEQAALVADNRWLGSRRELEKAAGEAAEQSEGAACRVLEGQLKLATRVFGWRTPLLEADRSLDLSLSQGSCGVAERKGRLLATMVRVCDLARRLRLQKREAPAMVPLARPSVVACGQRTAKRRSLDGDWEQKLAKAVELANEDDPELAALHAEFTGKKFHDSGPGFEETRVIKEINYSAEWDMFMANTRRLAADGSELGVSRPKSDDFYGLGDGDLEEMRRMIMLVEQ